MSVITLWHAAFIDIIMDLRQLQNTCTAPRVCRMEFHSVVTNCTSWNYEVSIVTSRPPCETDQIHNHWRSATIPNLVAMMHVNNAGRVLVKSGFGQLFTNSHLNGSNAGWFTFNRYRSAITKQRPQA